MALAGWPENELVIQWLNDLNQRCRPLAAVLQLCQNWLPNNSGKGLLFIQSPFGTALDKPRLQIRANLSWAFTMCQMCPLHKITHLILIITQWDKVLLPYHRWWSQGTDDDGGNLRSRLISWDLTQGLQSQGLHTYYNIKLSWVRSQWPTWFNCSKGTKKILIPPALQNCPSNKLVMGSKLYP